MTTRGLWSLILPSVVAGAFAVAASQPPPAPPGAPPPRPGQATPQPQRPTFRAAANFVQVDVYPTANGKPVADLTQSDFDVLEDGVLQSVATFEHVSIRPADPGTPVRDPRSTAEERDLIADPHNRLFVIFLDSYHVTDPVAWHDGTMRMPGNAGADRAPREKKPLGQQPIDKAIVKFLERFIGPNDLVAAMSPEMEAGRMVFSRRPERFSEWVSTAWAKRFSWDDLEPEEERWAICYPPDPGSDPNGCFTGIFEEMVLRKHEARTLQALEDTVTRLGQLREGRKALLLVSEGWELYRQDQKLARALPPFSKRGCAPEPPPPKGIYVGPGGRLQTGTDPRQQSADLHECDAERLRLSLLDNESEYRRLLDRANRETVSVYPIDPRGLAVFDTPLDAKSPAGPARGGVIDEFARVRGHLETLSNLASATDGFASMSNDLNASMKRVADDLSEYYLLGYNSTNSALDGKFRRITVRVKRPGVQVRARRGYLAATKADLPPEATPVDPSVRLRESALASLGTMPADLSLRLDGGYDWTAGPAASLWVVAELGDSTARLPEWQAGGEAQISVTSADGAVVASGQAPLSSVARAFAWRPDARALAAGDYVVRINAKPTTAGAPSVGGQVRVTLPAAGAMAGGHPATPRLLRRGPTTGLNFVPTADVRFRRVERLRLEVSLGSAGGPVSARLLDRRGQTMSVPVASSVRDDDGARTAVADAVLASLAPGDYVVEVALGDSASRQVVVVAVRIVP
jgi:VWFA-related protein